MFTGIIVSTGLFKGYRRGRHEMQLEAADLAPKLEPGASLAVNGVCLSLVSKDKGALAFDLSQETLGRTNLGTLRPGARLNLELPLTLGSLVGGHLVSGHIDAVGKVVRLAEKRPGKRLFISFPSVLRPYFIPKGSVAVNGVSLTIAALEAATFETELIPLTLKGTNLGDLRSGDPVNLECDMIGKYAYNWFVPGRNRR
jgi:riboflavin synthase